jgi:glycyl-tRNA synthetase beta subunit
MLLDKGFNYDVVDAVLAEEGKNPYGAFLGVRALSAWVEREDWGQILPAFSRCVRIVRDLDETYQVQEALLAEESEKLLYQALVKAEKEMAGTETVDAFLNAFLPMVPVINRFFDEVLVMAEVKDVRENRLALCQRVAALSNGVADLSCLEGF